MRASLLLATLAAARAAAPPPAACAAVSSRAPCGQPSDSPALCAAKGCCFAAGGGPLSCFYAADAVPVTRVHVVQACRASARRRRRARRLRARARLTRPRSRRL